jgi:hypothetical protein
LQGSSYLFAGLRTQSAGDLRENEPRSFALALTLGLYRGGQRR